MIFFGIQTELLSANVTFLKTKEIIVWPEKSTLEGLRIEDEIYSFDYVNGVY